ncbi:MAG: hypothetical protein ABIS14_15045 [Sphingomonas sp.]
MSAAERGMTGERQFASRREDAQLIVRAVNRRRQQEGGFGKVGPASNRLHPIIVEMLSIKYHSYRIA